MDKRGKELRERLLAAFRVEAQEHLQALSSGLIALEGTSTQDERMPVVETIFREAHSLKGAARAIDQAEIEAICQAMESVLSAIKRNELKVSSPLCDVLNDALDAVDKLLPAVGNETGEKATLSYLSLLNRLEQAMESARRTSSKWRGKTPSEMPAPSRADPPTATEDRALATNTVRISTAKLDAVLIQSEELLSAKLAAFQLSTEVRDALAELAALKRERAKVAPSKRFLQQAWEKEARRSGYDKADPQWRKFLEFIAWESVFLKTFEAKLEALAKSAEQDQRNLGTMVDGLLEDMKRALMLPVSTALAVFPKLVRDLARDQGKEVDLIVRGDEIEIDRRILDELRDPLVHLARNCIDHGIEAPEIRGGAGKPPRGTLTLIFSQREGSKVEIVVSDDGAGIDAAKVREVALKLGIASGEEDGDDESTRLGLIFHSGVSTSPIITDISGRGLGLAIVREKVERLGGSVSVEAQRGRGTTFTMVVPLTLSTFRGVRVRVDDRHFVLPATHVEQCLSLRADAVMTVENRETVPWRGQAVALVHLADALDVPGRRATRGADEMLHAVILGSAGRQVAFGVDEIVGEQEVLVKPLGRHLPRLRSIAGATVLGTGKVALILDVPDLLRSAVSLSSPRPMLAMEDAQGPLQRKSILVTEDSITSRSLLKNVLESAGYQVATAVDGIDGLTRLKTEHFDLVVSDVEMPRMNGFDLTARIRADNNLARLPVVLVTALESREHRELGVDVGANAYIVKSSFDQSNLLDIIRRLI